MGNERIQKIVHDGKEEVLRCHEQAKLLPKSLFDTQIASCFADPFVNGVLDLQPSLRTLVKKHASVLLDKTLQASDWEKRPLEDKQIEYAANDVRFLITVRDRLDELLRAEGREKLRACFVSECKLLCEWKGKNKANLVFESLGRREWTVKQYGNLLGLIKWREAKSKALGRNKKRFLPDDTMISLARTATNEELAIRCEDEFKRVLALGGISAETSEEYLQNDYCFALCKTLCLSHGIYPELVPLRARLGYEFVHMMRYLRKYERFPEDCFLSSGWRWEFIGQPLLDFVCHKKAILFS